MKNSILILALIFSIGSFAQKRAIKKTKKLFIKKKYTECIQYAQKQLKKHDDVAEFHYYISYAQIKSRKKYNYDTSFYHFLQAHKLDKEQKLNIHKRDKKLYDSHVNRVRRIYKKRSVEDAQKYLDSFITVFNDTLHFHKIAQKHTTQSIVNNHNLSLIDSIVNYAISHEGKPYAWGKEGPNAFDCSGFILFVHQKFDIQLPHNAHMISELEKGKEVTIHNIKKGDLVFFGSSRAYHVGMYVSAEGESPKIIHCVSRGVTIDDFVDGKHWNPSKIYKVKRFH